MVTTMEQTDMQALEQRITKLDEKLDNLTLTMATQLATISGQITSRAEIAAEDAKRVSLERFEGEMSGMRERISRLESGPQKVLGWISLAVAAFTGCLSAILAAVGVCVAILAVLATVIIAILTH